jgi:DNA primase
LFNNINRKEKRTNVVKLEKVQEILETINPLLVLEEKLVELMLKYGDYVLDRKTPENEAYQITVIEEIINHLEEDHCEIISPINQKIIEEIKLGIQQSELRSGNFL